MPFTNKTTGKSPYITAAIHFATGTGLTLFPGHAVRFSSIPGSRNILAEDRELATSILNNAIDAVSITKDFIPIDVVKGALSGSVSILIIVRVCTRLYVHLCLISRCPTGHKSNKGALAELALSCSNTCLALKRGVVGKTERDISPQYLPRYQI